MSSSFFKKALAKYLLHTVRQKIKHPDFIYNYDNLHNAPSLWKNKDYENLASVLNVNTPTVKRLFDCPGYTNHQQFNNSNKQRFTDFLELNTWEEVEKEAVFYVLDSGLEKE